jgi:hypothetical protein
LWVTFLETIVLLTILWTITTTTLNVRLM